MDNPTKFEKYIRERQFDVDCRDGVKVFYEILGFIHYAMEGVPATKRLDQERDDGVSFKPLIISTVRFFEILTALKTPPSSSVLIKIRQQIDEFAEISKSGENIAYIIEDIVIGDKMEMLDIHLTIRSGGGSWPTTAYNDVVQLYKWVGELRLDIREGKIVHGVFTGMTKVGLNNTPSLKQGKENATA